MSRKASLDTQTGKLNIIIRKNKAIDSNRLLEYCNTYFEDYAYICHEKDIEPATGQVEGIHYHIVANAKDKRKRLATWLNEIVNFFGFKDSNGVEVDRYNSWEGAIQYLIHKNNPEKTPHKFDEIITNIDKQELLLYFKAEFTSCNYEMIESLCCSCKNIREVFRQIPWKWLSTGQTFNIVKFTWELIHTQGE